MYPSRAYFDAMVDSLDGRDPLAVMAATPDALRERVVDVDTALLAEPEAPGKWSALGVARHLADTEVVLAVRYRKAIAEPAQEIPGFDQDAWYAAMWQYDEPIDEVVERFAVTRRSNLRLLRTVTGAQREVPMRHPERGEESLGRMIPLYAAHDEAHLRQLDRVLAAVRQRAEGG